MARDNSLRTSNKDTCQRGMADMNIFFFYNNAIDMFTSASVYELSVYPEC